MGRITGKKVLMVIAPKDFRDEELLVTKKVLEKAGAQVTVASKTTMQARGMLGATFTPNVAMDKVKGADFDCVIFVGGAGSQMYFSDAQAHRLAKEAADKAKVVGAICIAPMILANANLLAGKKSTVFESMELGMRQKGAVLVRANVVQDGKFVTGKGPEVAEEFGSKIVEALSA